MGFLGDIKEIQESWKDKSWVYKLLVIASIFFTTSSLTGLTGLVIKWKGFLKDGIDFYQSYMLGPIKNSLAFVEIDISQRSLDLLTINLLVGIPLLLVLIRGFKIKRNIESLLGLLAIIGFILMITLPFFLEPDENYTIFLVAVYLFSLIFAIVFKDKEVLRLLLRPLIAIFIVLILAAVNKGLQAPI